MQTALLQPVVIDTNVVLDLFGFGDPHVQIWAQRLGAVGHPATYRWLATESMRDELVSVLQREHLIRAFAKRGRSCGDVLAGLVNFAEIVMPPGPLEQAARVHCTDADDQKFIDLALANRACLLSKDRAVIKCKRRLAVRGVELIVPG